MKQNAQRATLEIQNEYEKAPAGFTTEAYALVSIKAPEREEEKEEEREPVDLIMVVDRSGSMSGTPIRLVKEALKFIVGQLNEKDRFSVVSYSSNVTTDIELTNVTGNEKANMINKIDSIRASGSTNLSEGLSQGINIAKKVMNEENRVRSIFLLTDGQANCGLSNEQTVEMVKGTGNAFKEACSINTFGFSADHDSAFLQKISAVGNGLYFFIKDSDAIGESFVSCFGGLVSVVAKKVILTINVANKKEVVIEKVHTAYNMQHLKDDTYRIDFFDLQSEESRDVLVKMKLQKMSETLKTPTLVATLSYYNCLEEKDIEKKTLAYIDRVNECPKQEPNEKVDEERNRVLAAETMLEVNRFGADGDFESAKRVLKNNMKKIKESKTSSKAADMLADMAECDAFLAPQAYSRGGSHQMASNFDGWGRQRATGTRQKSMKKHSNKRKMKLLNMYTEQ